jgi:dCTP deaminase
MFNLSGRPIILHLGMKICQLSFSKLDSQCMRPYGHPDLKSRYQGQTGVTESRVSVEEKP